MRAVNWLRKAWRRVIGADLTERKVVEPEPALPSTDLTPYIAAIDDAVREIAAAAGMPVHFLTDGPTSGDALRERLTVTGRPMTPEEQQCDCGCMDVERGPVEDLTFYAESIWPPKDAGVEPGHLVIWTEGVAACKVIPMALLHDGEGHMVTQVDHEGARDGTIVDNR